MYNDARGIGVGGSARIIAGVLRLCVADEETADVGIRRSLGSRDVSRAALGRVVIDHPVVVVPEHKHGGLRTVLDGAGHVDGGTAVDEQLR